MLITLCLGAAPLRADQADIAYGCTPKVFSSTITYYDNAPLGLSACHYSDPTLPGGAAKANQYYAAVATHLYDDGVCGACAEITDSGNGKKVTVMITDECPAASNPTHCSSGSNHLDISQNAFGQLEALGVGVFNATWKVVPCPNAYMNVKSQNGANLTYQFKSGASSGWATLIIRDYIMPIKSVQYCSGLGTGCSAAAWQRSYNGWVPSGSWSTIYLRITDKGGNVRDFGPISCCSPMGTDAKTETSAVYGNIPGGQMPGCGAAATATPTDTPLGTSTNTPNWTKTATPTTTPLPVDCPLMFNDFDGLASNGILAGVNATRSVNGAGPSVVQGLGSVKAQITVPNSFNDQVMQITNFAPTNWQPYTRVTLSFYVDPAALPWSAASTYHKLALYADASSVAKYERTISTADVDLVPGMNSVNFTLAWGADVNHILATDVLSKIYLIINQDGQQAGTVYFDNMVLHTDAVCPPATATPSATRTSSPTPANSPTSTGTPSRTSSPTLTSTPLYSSTFTGTPSSTFSPTPSSTETPTATLSRSPTSTFTNTVATTPTYTWTPTYTLSPTMTLTPISTSTFTPTATLTRSPTPTYTSTVATTPTFTWTPTLTVTPTPSRTMTQTFSMTNTPQPGSPTFTMTSTTFISPTPTHTPTRTATVTWTPSCTATPSATPVSTLTNTPLANTATFSATPTSTSVPPTATPTFTATRTSTVTLTPTQTHTPVPGSPTFTFTLTPFISSTSTVTSTLTGTGTQTRTPTPTYSPTWSFTLTSTPVPGSPTFTMTATRTNSPLPTASNTVPPTATRTQTPLPTASVTTAPAPTVSGISVTQGPVGGGTFVTISGSNFVSGAAALLNGTALTGLSFVSSTTLTGFTPAGSAGLATLVVRNPDAQQGSLINAFDYKAPTPTPSFTPGGSAPTATAVPDGENIIEHHGVAPSPNDGSGVLALKLKGHADSVELRVYSKGMICVGTSRIGATAPGWRKLPLPAELLGEPSGLYYYRVKSIRHGEANLEPGIGSFMVIK